MKTMKALALQAYEQHQIRKRSDGRWLLMRPLPDGSWSFEFWAEIICLYGGQLYVGGDVEPVVFSSYKAPGSSDEAAIGRVRWMSSRESAHCRYLQSKAIAGTGYEAILKYDPEEAVRQVEEFLAEVVAEARENGEPEPIPAVEAWREVIADGDSARNEYSFCESLHNASDGAFSDWLYESRLGMVPTTRLHHAWAALRRLSDLLDREGL